MLKSPKRTKYRKQQKNLLTNTLAPRGAKMNHGLYGLRTNETKNISAQQIEICRRNLRRIIARKASI